MNTYQNSDPTRCKEIHLYPCAGGKTIVHITYPDAVPGGVLVEGPFIEGAGACPKLSEQLDAFRQAVQWRADVTNRLVSMDYPLPSGQSIKMKFWPAGIEDDTPPATTEKPPPESRFATLDGIVSELRDGIRQGMRQLLAEKTPLEIIAYFKKHPEDLTVV